MPRFREERVVWLVRVPAHEIPRVSVEGRRMTGGYGIPESVAEVMAVASARSAIAEAVVRVHVREGVPSWRPYLRHTARMVRAERTVRTVER